MVHDMKPLFFTTLVLLSGTSLIACQTTPPVQTRSVVEQQLPSLPDLWTEQGQTAPLERQAWVDRLNDPVLSDLVREAMSNAPQLKSVRAELDRAKALTRQARSTMLPQVAGQFGAARSGLVEGPSNTSMSFGLNIDWEADLWGRLDATQQASLDSLRAAQSDLRGARNLMAATVAQAYLVLIEADLQETIATEIVSSASQVERIVQIRLDDGLGSPQDLSLARADLARAREIQIQAEAAKRLSARALETLIGRYPSATLSAQDTLPTLPSLPAVGLPSELLERRPDIVAAERRVAAALNVVESSKAAKLPGLSLSGQFGGSSSELSDILDPTNLAWQAASALFVPVFNGGALDAQIDLAEADVQAVAAVYASVALNAFAEVENALDQWKTLQERQEQLDQAVEENANAYRVGEILYKEGETGLLDLLILQQRKFAARSDQLTVSRLQLEQYLQLSLALGGDWEGDVSNDLEKTDVVQN